MKRFWIWLDLAEGYLTHSFWAKSKQHCNSIFNPNCSVSTLVQTGTGFVTPKNCFVWGNQFREVFLYQNLVCCFANVKWGRSNRYNCLRINFIYQGLLAQEIVLRHKTPFLSLNLNRPSIIKNWRKLSVINFCFLL